MSKRVKVSEVLRKLGACPPALRWVRQQECAGKGDFAALWVACPNDGWMWWLAWELFKLGDLPVTIRWAISEAWVHEMGPAGVRRAVGWLHYPAVEAAFLRAARAS